MFAEGYLQNILDFWAKNKPDGIACIDESGQHTYSEVANASNAIATSILESGVGKGGKVVVLIQNNWINISIFFALLKIGAVYTPCNSKLSQSEIVDRANLIEPDLVITDNQESIDYIRDHYDTEIITHKFSCSGYRSIEEIINRSKVASVEMADIDFYEDMSALFFSSGSTSVGRGVMLTYYCIAKAALSLGQKLNMNEQDRIFVPLPVAHLFNLVPGVIMPVLYGATSVLIERFCASDALNFIEKSEATGILGVPTMYVRLINEQQENPRDISKLSKGLIAGAACFESLIRQIEDIFDCKINAAYGSTETINVSSVCMDDQSNKRYSTVGKINDYLDLKLIYEDGTEAECLDIGEILCRGCIMKGYYKMSDETNKAIDDDGWFHTGDLGMIDSDGYLKIVGRKSNLIIRGGYNIMPAELEKEFLEHPSVREVCVFGQSHEELGEEIFVIIALIYQGTESEESLKSYISDKVAKYKRPDRIILLNDLPKLENGKFDLCNMRELIRKNSKEK